MDMSDEGVLRTNTRESGPLSDYKFMSEAQRIMGVRCTDIGHSTRLYYACEKN